ncbi:MAG: hypothetical protein H5T64_09705 [Chloroflexi bacterium]|nr:hypothetical protein [Chloroflexota bacterium]
MEEKKDLFEQVERWLVVGLLTLAILLVFGSVAQRAQQQMALAPTPLLPVPTLTSEPYPPPIRTRPPTITPQPNPPPQTPTVPPPATPTTEPPTPIVTPPVPITSTLEIIWAETAWIREENRPVSITFWRANVADLANRTELATLSIGHMICRASISPNGNHVAFTTCPSIGGCGQGDDVLWVMNIDGSRLKQLAQGLVGGTHWSRDSKTVTYKKEVLKQPPPASTDVSPFIYEIHTIATDGTDDKALVVDDTADSVAPLGWSPDGRQLFYQRSTPGIGYELWAVDANGETPPQFVSFLFPGWGVVRFSPDGAKLTIYTQEEGLVLLSSDGKERRVLSPPSEPFGGIWSADSTEIIGSYVYKNELQLRALNVNTGATRVLVTAQLTDISDDLLAISPDHQWLALKGYRRGEIDLLWIGTNLRVEVPAKGIASFVGWIARRP